MSKKATKSKPSKSAKPGKTIASIEVISDEVKTVKPAKEPKVKVAKPAQETKPKKFSALDAAAQLLALASQPLNCKQLIELMTAQGLWNSPKGKTPSATLYAAIIREIATKGDQSRFIRAEAGKFTSKAAILS
jgi:hypothetical protein